MVELLVVIAIIGLLASIIIASLTSTQERARDARRMEDIGAIEKALALHTASGGTYPIQTSTTTLTGSDSASQSLINAGDIQAIPIDPLQPMYVYQYSSDSSGSIYMISFCLETNSIRNYNQGCGNTVAK